MYADTGGVGPGGYAPGAYGLSTGRRCGGPASLYVAFGVFGPLAFARRCFGPSWFFPGGLLGSCRTRGSCLELRCLFIFLLFFVFLWVLDAVSDATNS